MGSLVFGVEWKQLIEDAINSGQPLTSAFVLARAVPTLAFLAARSLIGFAEWRSRRELWPGDGRLVEVRLKERR